jgi:hypothetical protein
MKIIRRKIKMKEKMMRLYNNTKNGVQKHSPEILAGVGVVGTVVSGVMACKATLKLNDILEESKETSEKIREVEQNPRYEKEYNHEDAKKDLAVNYAQTAMKIAKLYAPAVILGSASLGCLLASNDILRKRNAALSAAYMTVDKSFKEYRNRVAERFGDEIEKEIRYGIKAMEVETTVVNEDGSETTITEQVKVMDPNLYSDYARFFDEASPCWQNDPEYNLMFLKSQQQYANDLLKAKGRLFLNEVYDMLGIDRSKAGQVVGWVYNPENPTGDNFVDFGIYDMSKERVRAFVNGYETNILLDFNVDGNIWDLM